MSAATTTASLEEVEALVEQEPLIGLTLVTILVFLVSAVFYVSMVQSTIGPDDYDDLDPAVVEHHNWLQTREEEQERAEWQAEVRRPAVTLQAPAERPRAPAVTLQGPLARLSQVAGSGESVRSPCSA